MTDPTRGITLAFRLLAGLMLASQGLACGGSTRAGEADLPVAESTSGYGEAGGTERTDGAGFTGGGGLVGSAGSSPVGGSAGGSDGSTVLGGTGGMPGTAGAGETGGAAGAPDKIILWPGRPCVADEPALTFGREPEI